MARLHSRAARWLVVATAALVATVAAARPPESDALAKKLVDDCAGITSGQFVIVSGSTRDATLLEDIAVAVRQAGAFPIITYGSDRLTRRLYDDVPARHDSQVNEAWLKLASAMDAEISVEQGEVLDLLAHVPPGRLTATAQANEVIGHVMRSRGVRTVNLGNDLYPTEARAKQYGVTRDALADVFWNGVNVDYDALQATGEAVRRAFGGGREVRLTNPNGTDLTMKIAGRSIFVSDGVVSEQDRAQGGAACQVWLPAGEVYLTAVPGTAEGKVVVDRQYFQGKEIRGLTLTFHEGRLTTMTAQSDMSALQARYDAGPPGKDAFAGIDVGINPNVNLPPDGKMVAWMPAGMVTVGIGGNTWAGGENDAPFGVWAHVPGSTLKVDGRAIVENGRLVVTPPGAMGQ
jgi:leucyl aminopeptidase (aminopeptidase T)